MMLARFHRVVRVKWLGPSGSLQPDRGLQTSMALQFYWYYARLKEWLRNDVEAYCMTRVSARMRRRCACKLLHYDVNRATNAMISNPDARARIAREMRLDRGPRSRSVNAGGRQFQSSVMARTQTMRTEAGRCH